MADTRVRGSSPSRAIRNRSRERERVKERETNDQKATIDREKVQILICIVNLDFWSREIGSRSKSNNISLLQYVALFPGHPYFRTLRLYDSVLRCKHETNPNDSF